MCFLGSVEKNLCSLRKFIMMDVDENLVLFYEVFYIHILLLICLWHLFGSCMFVLRKWAGFIYVLCITLILRLSFILFVPLSFIFFSFGNSLSLTTHQEREGVPLSLCFNIFSALNHFIILCLFILMHSSIVLHW